MNAVGPVGQALLDEIRLRKFWKKVLRTERASIISYLPLREASGSVASDLSGNGRNGAYTNVTLGQPGIGDGWTSGLFDGSTSYVNWHSAALAAAFNGAEGALLICAKAANAGVWTDASTDRFVWLQEDGSNFVFQQKAGASNSVTLGYYAGAVGKEVTKSSFSPSGWFNLALTWSALGDEVGVYVNGVLEGPGLTGLGTWAGALASTTTIIGAQNTGVATPTNGFLAHCALWSKALTPAQVASLKV